MIKEGNVVVFYYSDKLFYILKVKKGEKFSSHKGEIQFDEIIGKNYGDFIKTHLGHKFYLLRPTLYDLQISVKRRTNIVYPKDAGFIIMKSFIYPGAQVIEAGTGSGSMTTLLAKLVAPSGHVYSYDYREDLQKIGKTNIEKLHLEKYVDFFLQDVYTNEFIQKDVDSVILDLPEPWKAVNNAKISLKGGGNLISLSPNIEQVKKTVTYLEIENFIRIETFEIFLRPILIRKEGSRPVQRYITHTLYITTAYKLLTS